MDANNLDTKDSVTRHDDSASHFVKPPVFQKGILRTNCIDCLDRTDAAQYVYGLVALAHQLHVLGYIDVPSITLDSPLADDLMKIYEAMGDTLALQYGGSSAHNKAVYEHPRPKQLIVENSLPHKLQNLIERRDGQSLGYQVLVKQMDTPLLKALHINTVL